MSPAAKVLRVMHLVEVNVRDVGITASTEKDSLCLFRPVYDKPNATTYAMSSAINTFQRGELFRRVYCVEQSDSGGQLVKFSIQLKDQAGYLLGQWDLDFSHGFHTHSVKGGKKESEHIPFEGGVCDVAFAIAAQIKAEIQVDI